VVSFTPLPLYPRGESNFRLMMDVLQYYCSSMDEHFLGLFGLWDFFGELNVNKYSNTEELIQKCMMMYH
jgi:hypothetical protein